MPKRRCPRFEQVFRALEDESLRRRRLFGSIMEPDGVLEPRRKPAWRTRSALTAALIALCAVAGGTCWLALFSFRPGDSGAPRVTGHRGPSTAGERQTPQTPRDTLEAKPDPGPAIVTQTESRIDTAGRVSTGKRHVSSGPAVMAARSGEREPSAGEPDEEFPAEADSSDSTTDTTASPRTVAVLVPVAGSSSLFQIAGGPDSCNLANVCQIAGADTVCVSDLAGSSPVYVSRRTSAGRFASIVRARRCHSPACSSALLYTAIGYTGLGGPLTVTPGDLVAFNYAALRAYRQSRFRSFAPR